MDSCPRTRANACVPERVVTGSALHVEPSVFGFSIRSVLPLKFLRSGGGVQPLEVVTAENTDNRLQGELLGEWPLQGTSYPAHARLFRIPRGYDYWTSDAGLYRVDLERGRIEVPGAAEPLLREQRLHGLPMILSFQARGDLSLHAAAVEIGSSAVILAAPSRYGKTTVAFAFQRMGHRVLSEDLICCRPETAEAIPGPAVLRLRPDVFHGDLPDGLFVIEERPDRVFIGFDAAHAGSGAPVPVKAIVFLREADEFAAEEVPRVTALKDLWSLSFRTGTQQDRGDTFQRLATLAGSVPFWNVHRPLIKSALGRTVELIQKTVDLRV